MSFQHYFLRSTFGDIALDNSHCLSRVLTYFLDFWTIFWNFWNFVGESQKVLTGALLELTVRDHPFSTYEGGEEEGFIKMRTKVYEGSPESVRAYIKISQRIEQIPPSPEQPRIFDLNISGSWKGIDVSAGSLLSLRIALLALRPNSKLRVYVPYSYSRGQIIDRSKFTGYLGRVLGKISWKKSPPPFLSL